MSVSNYPGVSFKYQGGNYFVGTGTPVGTVGDLWSDTTTGVVLKVCTTAPSTWESVEGGAGSFTDLAASGTLTLSGVITPTQLAANTDNWAPTGLSGAAVIRVSTDASRNLTGITGGAAGRILILQNVGSFDLVLMNDVTSTAANRFLLGADITVATNKCAILQYDTTSSRWRGIATPSASSGQGNWIAADAGAAPTVAPTAAGADAISIGDGSTAAGVNGIVLGCSAVGGANENTINIGTFANSGVTAGTRSITIGSDDDAVNNTRATGSGAIAVGSGSVSAPGALASGSSGIAIGSGVSTLPGAIASSTGAIAIGAASEAEATGAIAVGYFANNNIASGAFSVCIGAAQDQADSTRATGVNAVAVGSGAAAGGNGALASGLSAVAIGGAESTANGPIASGAQSVAIGGAISSATAAGALASTAGAIAIGGASEADGTSAIAIGYFANSGITAGAYSVTIGSDDSATDNAQATGAGAIAVGSSGGSTGNAARAAGANAIALGSATGAIDGPIASAANAVAIGSANATTAGALASTTGAIAVGSASEADGTSAIAIGYFANSGITAGAYSICIGADNDATDNAQATGAGAIAVGSSGGSTGDGARAAGARSIAIGSAVGALSGANAAGTGSVVIGGAADNPSNNGVVCIGLSAGQGATSGAYSVAIGGADDTLGVQAAGAAAVAIGGGNAFSNGARAAGSNSTAIGGANGFQAAAISSAADSIAIGGAVSGTAPGALASTTGAIAIGNASEADGTSAIALGYFANNGITAGAYSICIGADNDGTDNAQATGASAIAIGSSAGSTGDGARASGANSIAIGGGNGADSAPIASGTHATSIGNLGSATRYGEHNFGITGATASLISKFSLRGTTTNNTPTEIFIRGTASNRITIASDTGAGFIATCTARRTDADGECGFFKVEGGIDNNAGTTAGFGATPFVTTPVTTDFTTATVVASADNTNDALVFTVTGETAKTINWLINVEVCQITG